MTHIGASSAAIGPSIFAVSGLLFAVFIARVIDWIGDLFLPVAVTMAFAAPAFLLLGQSFTNDHAFLLACGLAGALSVSSVNLMGVVASALYEDKLRARGVGWAVATMRLGAALAPWLGGFLIARAVPVEMMFIGLAVTPLASGLAVLALRQMTSRQRLKGSIMPTLDVFQGLLAGKLPASVVPVATLQRSTAGVMSR